MSGFGIGFQHVTNLRFPLDFLQISEMSHRFSRDFLDFPWISLGFPMAFLQNCPSKWLSGLATPEGLLGGMGAGTGTPGGGTFIRPGRRTAAVIRWAAGLDGWMHFGRFWVRF